MFEVNALIALLTLVSVVVGGMLKLLMSKVSGLDQRLSDERVKSAERFVTSEEVDRRLEQSFSAVNRRLDHIETQNDRILQAMLDQKVSREVSSV